MLTQLLSNTPHDDADFSGRLALEVEKTQIELVLSFCNNWAAVSTCEIERLRPALSAVLAGAITGVSGVFSYLNSVGV